jgi:hypothetical protein
MNSFQGSKLSPFVRPGSILNKVPRLMYDSRSCLHVKETCFEDRTVEHCGLLKLSHEHCALPSQLTWYPTIILHGHRIRATINPLRPVWFSPDAKEGLHGSELETRRELLVYNSQVILQPGMGRDSFAG